MKNINIIAVALIASNAVAGNVTPEIIQKAEAYKATMPIKYHNSSNKSFVDFNLHADQPQFSSQNRIIRFYYNKENINDNFIVDVEVNGYGGEFVKPIVLNDGTVSKTHSSDGSTYVDYDSSALGNTVVKIDDFNLDDALLSELINGIGPRYQQIYSTARAANSYNIGDLQRIGKAFDKYDKYRTIALSKKPDPIRKIILPEGSQDSQVGTLANEVDFIWDGTDAYAAVQAGGNGFNKVDDREVNFRALLYKKVVDIYQDAGKEFKMDIDLINKKKSEQNKMFN